MKKQNPALVGTKRSTVWWFCNSCHVEVPKGDRCQHCGKTKREKK